MVIPVGLVLRLVGPIVELACIGLLQRFGGQGRTVGGVAVEPLLYGGLGLGLVLVVLGLTVFRPRPQSGRAADRSFNRDGDENLDLDRGAGR